VSIVFFCLAAKNTFTKVLQGTKVKNNSYFCEQNIKTTTNIFNKK